MRGAQYGVRACVNDDILMINDYWRLVIKSCETRVKIFTKHLSPKT